MLSQMRTSLSGTGTGYLSPVHGKTDGVYADPVLLQGIPLAGSGHVAVHPPLRRIQRLVALSVGHGPL